MHGLPSVSSKLCDTSVDGNIRSVTVKTPNCEFMGPTVSLYLLDAVS